ncbi:hypothetical protein [Uliginosibacterium gangwonense]|uniref:hypothetical protein n=1 Tax=Uliginosibacterium gangwonense TaxID=392736 RepID=UPI000368C956|nr:hypothetical protein [Uliginosibacterium gangwonense]
MRFIFSVLGLLLLVSGCATAPIPLAPQSEALLKGKQIKLVEHKKEEMAFSTLTPGGAAFGMIGAAISSNNGKQAIAKFGLLDPAAEIAQGLAQGLANRYSARIATDLIPLGELNPEELARKQSADTLLLDVGPSGTMVVYYPTNWGKYRVMYGVPVKLFEGKSGQILAQGSCSYVPDDLPHAPSYDELFGGQGEVLKAHIKTGQTICDSKIRKELFRLPAQPDVAAQALPMAVPTAPVRVPSAMAAQLLLVTPQNGYAQINEIDKFPMSAKYRSSYEAYLASPKQTKMLVAGSKGGFYSTKNASLEQAHALFDRCLAQHPECWVYALNDEVVWSEDKALRISRDKLKPLTSQP